MIARELETPSVKRIDELGAIGDVWLSSKLDGLALFSAPLLLDPHSGQVDRSDQGVSQEGVEQDRDRPTSPDQPNLGPAASRPNLMPTLACNFSRSEE
jgi:hypothetical protein